MGEGESSSKLGTLSMSSAEQQKYFPIQGCKGTFKRQNKTLQIYKSVLTSFVRTEVTKAPFQHRGGCKVTIPERPLLLQDSIVVTIKTHCWWGFSESVPSSRETQVVLDFLRNIIFCYFWEK